ncbi:MAG: hypothetical protein QF898_11645 [SAR202 cluster bacterium]|jgi:hypothetical protein|nr:hypothetical protein [SAR202 cluster bacterium]MDP6716792.1 hypothetical protein [SAR202 cluster bacterium]
MSECKYELGQIVEYLTGGMAEDTRDELQAHVDAGCAQCEGQINTLGGFVQKPEPEKKEMVAQPLMDTQMAAPVGVRGGAVLTRRRVYEAESKVCIDIDQHELEPGMSTVEGQILVKGGDLDDLEGVEVSLRQDGVQVAVGSVDMLGDFTIEDVQSGNYDLTMSVGSLDVAIRGIEI